MSKEKFTVRIEESIRDEINQIQEQEQFGNESDATREVLRRGIEYSHEDSAGEQLGQVMTGVAAVGAVVASISVALGSLPVSIAVSFLAATVICSLLWASVRVLEGGDLW